MSRSSHADLDKLGQNPVGRNPEHRFNFIQNRAGEVDPDLIDA